MILMQKLIEHARSGPDRTALIENDVPVSYADFVGMTLRVRHWLAQERLPRGAFAAVIADGFRDQLVITPALRTLDMDAVNVANLQMLKELRLKNLACVAVTPEAASKPKTTELDPQVRLIVVPQELLVPSAASPEMTYAELDRPGGGYLSLTSGTTGRYKKLFQTGSDIEAATARAFDEGVIEYDQNTVVHGLNFPLYTGAGGSAAAVWLVGGHVIFHRNPDLLTNYFRHRPTEGFLSPAYVPHFLQAQPTSLPIQENFRLSIGGGFLPVALAETIVRQITPKLDIIYGSTEGGGVLRSRYRSPDDLHWLVDDRSRFEIVDEDGRPCPTGVEGELRAQIREFEPRGYLDDDVATAHFFRGGFFYPGDLAVRREDGRIRILGRTDDVLNLDGWKIPVAPLEGEIERTIGARAVCLFGETNEKGQEQVIVAVEADRLPPEDAIRGLLAGRPGFDRYRIAVLKSFPRSEVGYRKVNRRALRKLLD